MLDVSSWAISPSATSGLGPVCTWCGCYHNTKCPLVKAIEYHPNGAIKRVEFYP